MRTELDEAVNFINNLGVEHAEIGLILGSGLGGIVDDIDISYSIPTQDIPHYPKSTVEGHEGILVFGKIAGIPVIAVKGRTHLYEGYPIEKVIFMVRILHKLSVKKLIVTNSAGGANISFDAGDLMIITDHINLLFKNPLIGPNDETLGPRFPDMSEPYDNSFIDLAEKAAIKNKINIRKGVYCAVTGPNYETAAEVRMMQKIGADAIGMSTVPDVIAARHLGMKVLGISCVTNLGTGLSLTQLNHEEVTETANKSSAGFRALILDLIPQI